MIILNALAENINEEKEINNKTYGRALKTRSEEKKKQIKKTKGNQTKNS